MTHYVIRILSLITIEFVNKCAIVQKQQQKNKNVRQNSGFCVRSSVFFWSINQVGEFMNAAAEKQSLSFGECVIRARIEGSRRFEGKSYTRIVQPAASSYDKPAVNEVISNQSLGSPGDEVTVRVRIAGYPRKPYDFTDQKTGEVRRVQPVENQLVAVDA